MIKPTGLSDTAWPIGRDIGLSFAGHRQVLLLGTNDGGRTSLALHLAVMAVSLRLHPVCVDGNANRDFTIGMHRQLQRLRRSIGVPHQLLAADVRAAKTTDLEQARDTLVVIDGGRTPKAWPALARYAQVILFCLSDNEDVSAIECLIRRVGTNTPLERHRQIVRSAIYGNVAAPSAETLAREVHARVKKKTGVSMAIFDTHELPTWSE